MDIWYLLEKFWNKKNEINLLNWKNKSIVDEINKKMSALKKYIIMNWRY